MWEGNNDWKECVVDCPKGIFVRLDVGNEVKLQRCGWGENLLEYIEMNVTETIELAYDRLKVILMIKSNVIN
jgi:hypothetical protein